MCLANESEGYITSSWFTTFSSRLRSRSLISSRLFSPSPPTSEHVRIGHGYPSIIIIIILFLFGLANFLSNDYKTSSAFVSRPQRQSLRRTSPKLMISEPYIRVCVCVWVNLMNNDIQTGGLRSTRNSGYSVGSKMYTWRPPTRLIFAQINKFSTFCHRALP